MQNVIEAALNLREAIETGTGLSTEAIEQVTLHRRGRGHSGPIPRSGLDGKFSAEYCAAAALLDGQVGIDTFTDARRFAPDMEEMLGRIKVEPEGPESGATRATALLKDGNTVSAECAAFRGSAKNPMEREERLVKVRDCFKPGFVGGGHGAGNNPAGKPGKFGGCGGVDGDFGIVFHPHAELCLLRGNPSTGSG